MIGRTKKHGYVAIDYKHPRLGTFSGFEKAKREVRKVIREVLTGGVHTYNIQ